MNPNEIGIAEVGFVRKYIEAKSYGVTSAAFAPFGCRLKCFLNPEL